MLTESEMKMVPTLDALIIVICCTIMIVIGVIGVNSGFFIYLGSILLLLYILDLARLIIKKRKKEKEILNGNNVECDS